MISNPGPLRYRIKTVPVVISPLSLTKVTQPEDGGNSLRVKQPLALMGSNSGKIETSL